MPTFKRRELIQLDGNRCISNSKTTNDWFHTGIVTAVHGDIIETIEGNTVGGYYNGNTVMNKIEL
jgi:hypothetical protein